jgi:hypothetical protein
MLEQGSNIIRTSLEQASNKARTKLEGRAKAGRRQNLPETPVEPVDKVSTFIPKPNQN